MTILNSTGLNKDSWGTPFVTDLHLDIEPLTATYICSDFPQVVMNLIMSYSGREFALTFSALRSIQEKGVGREVASEECGKKGIGYLLLLRCCQADGDQRVCFLWPLFPVWHTCRSPCLYPCHVQLLLCFGFPDSIPTQVISMLHSSQETCLCFHFLFFSCPLVWPAGLDSAIAVSCLPFLISYTWTSRALTLHEKHP